MLTFSVLWSVILRSTVTVEVWAILPVEVTRPLRTRPLGSAYFVRSAKGAAAVDENRTEGAAQAGARHRQGSAEVDWRGSELKVVRTMDCIWG